VLRARACLDEGIAIARPLGDPTLLAGLLISKSFAEFKQGDQEGARASADEAEVLARQSGDMRMLAGALRCSGLNRMASLDEQSQARGRIEMQEALGYYESLHDSLRIGFCHDNLGYMHVLAGNLDEARSHYAAAAAQWDAAEGRPANIEMAALTNQTLAVVALLQKDLPGAIRYLHQSVATGSVDESTRAYQLLVGALCASAGADLERAAVLHGAADALLGGIDEAWQPLEADLREQDQHRLRESLGDEAFGSAYHTGTCLTKTDAVALALHSPHGDDRE
jgi:hypothetical protein